MQEQSMANKSNTEEFVVHKVYMKELSHDTPNAPSIFKVDWKPDLGLDISTEVESLGDTMYEVTLSLKVTVKSQDITAFIITVRHTGIFSIQGHGKEKLQQLLTESCPEILYPYSREAIGDTVSRAGFPQLILVPLNFSALNRQKVAEASVN